MITSLDVQVVLDDIVDQLPNHISIDSFRGKTFEQDTIIPY